MLAPDRRAVDVHRMDAGGAFGGALERGGVGDAGRIEHRQIGVAAGLDLAASGQAELGGGQAGHFPDGGLQREQAQVAGIMAEHAREGAPQARMRPLVMRQAVGANHGGREGQDALHVALVHHEIDGAGGLQFVDHVVLGLAALGRHLVQLAPGQFGEGLAPGDDDAAGQQHAVFLEHGGAGHVGIGVQRHVLRGHGALDQRQRFLERPKLGWPASLWCEITTGTSSSRPMRKVSSSAGTMCSPSSRIWVA